MRPVKFTLLLVSPILGLFQSYGQGEVPVNMYTGSPGIFINLYAVKDHDLTESINLSYSLNDLNLNAAHRYGVGWDLTPGGQISREVRGLPDDFAGASGDNRRGWLYNNNYAAVLAFPNASDLTQSTCSDEQTDQAFINTTPYLKDTEPDMFSFSIGNYSGRFVFGNDGNIQMIPYQDILVSPTYKNAPTDMTIIKWVITTSDGVVYTFDQKCGSSYHITKSSNDASGVNQTMLTAFERDYELYKTNTGYYSAWMLGKTESPSGASLTYTYTDKRSVSDSERKAMLFDAQWQVSQQNIVKLSEVTLMTEHMVDTTKYISTITTSSGVWVSCDPVNGVKVYEPLRSPTESFKEFLFTYSGAFLTAVTETDHTHCNQMPPYRLYYSNTNDYPLPGGSSLQSQDFWGYYNGADNIQPVSGGGFTTTSIPTIYVYPNEPAAERYRLYPIPSYAGFSVVLNGNAYRRPDPNYITNGTLSRLVYPTGGETDLTFEANKFYDAKAGRDQYGGGIRINSMVYYNGVDPAPNIVKNFTYLDANGHSSGRLITRPSFAIPVWQYTVPAKGSNAGYTKLFSELGTATLQWRDLTLLTGWDVSDQDYTIGSAVGYTRVSVSRPGSGRAIFDYSVPGSYGDTATGSANTDWKPTTTKFARPSTCLPMGIISSGETGGYPLFPNMYYDYERGLLQAKSEYNESGTLVRYTQNTYQYIYKSTQPVNVTGLAYDLFAGSANIFLYGWYTNLTNVAKVIASETVTTYDEGNSARYAAEVTQYTYGSTNHRYPTKITRTTPDGTVYGTSLKYTLDYPASTSTPSDTTLWMIQMLKTANRNATVVEQQSTIKLFGGTEKTTGASLIKLRPFNINKPLLRYTLAFRPPTPVTDFAPSAVSSDVFTNDVRYETIGTVNEYTTSFDIPVSSTGEDRTTTAALYGFNNRLPVAQVTQARTVSVGFSDFETTTQASFNATGAYTGTGRTGATGMHPYATLTRTIIKPSTATNYLLTFWLKNTASTSVTLNVTLKNTTGTVLSSNNYGYTLTGNAYQYFVQPVDVSALPSTFVVQVAGQSLSQPSASSPSLLPMLDDVSFYPDYASISSVTYDLPFGPSASTDASGMTSYTAYDALGRVKWISDQDRNIRKRLTYNMPGQTIPGLIAALAGHNGHYYIDEDNSFMAQENTCISGELYEWDFGDGGGFTTPSTSATSPNHQYTALNAYTVALRVSHADHSQPATYTFQITTALPPLTAGLCASGVNTMNSSGTVTSTYSCGVLTPPSNPHDIVVKVLPDNVYGSTLTYAWKKRNVGTTTWNATGSNSDTLPAITVQPTMTSFEIMCMVTASDGRTVDSQIITVTIN
jgi:hypothetical protein